MSASAQAAGESEGEATEGEPGISRDELFHLLRNQRRRFALHHLKRRESVDVGDLATQVAAWENEVPVDQVSSKQRRRVYNALQQPHVPELEKTGVVNIERREVTLTERSEELDIYLEVVDGPDIPWSEYYLALAGVSLAVLIAVALRIEPLAAVPGAAAGIFVTVAFLVSAAANYYYQHESLLGGHERPPELRGE